MLAISEQNDIINRNIEAIQEAYGKIDAWQHAYTNWTAHEDSFNGVNYWLGRAELAQINIDVARVRIDELNVQLATAKKARAEFDANLALAGREGLIGDQAIARANALLQTAVTRRNIATIAAGVLAAIALIWFIRQRQKTAA